MGNATNEAICRLGLSSSNEARFAHREYNKYGMGTSRKTKKLPMSARPQAVCTRVPLKPCFGNKNTAKCRSTDVALSGLILARGKAKE